MAISKRKILKTTMLPGIWPRLKILFGSGFSYLAYLIAVVYNTVRILPSEHPYLNASNIGTYGVRQSIAAAANNIQIRKSNIDQIIIFFSILTAMVIMMMQFLLLALAALIPVARAQTMPTTIQGFFTTPNPQNDLAFRMLDLVFGIPNFFGSKEQTETAFHTALHSLLEFYSYGILVVGAMIIIYLVIAIVAETVQSGIPFGQRYNKSWAPIRLILFFGLLIPISNGLNGAQYLTLTSAKLGSGFATNGWIQFNEAINTASETLTGRNEQNVGYPESADLSRLPGFMMIAKTCQLAYNKTYNDSQPDTWNPATSDTGVKAWAIIEQGNTHSAELMNASTFQTLSAASEGRDISIVFGIKDTVNFSQYDASVSPICGEIVLRVTDVSEPGSAVIHTGYYDLLNDMWNGNNNMNDLNDFAENYVNKYVTINNSFDPFAPEPNQEYAFGWEIRLQEYMEGNSTTEGLIAQAVEAQINSGDWSMPKATRDLGWGGGGIWYNRIAQQNGALVNAIQSIPLQYKYPEILEYIKEIKVQTDQNPDFTEQFNLILSNDEGQINLPNREREIANALYTVFQFWESDRAMSKTKREASGNFVIDTINLLLGSEGLFEICRNTDIHPLAQLSVLGKSLLDRSIQSFAIGGGLGLLSAIPSPFGPAASSIGKMFSAFAGVGLLIGFVLFYVLPFLPFIYFFFAVGNWVKGIFEAIVAMPLWALAHLRIDGEGIPGDAAIGGYYLLFEIFLRPILIVFGLLAAITVFAAMVKVLNETFYLIISNLSGHDPKASTLCFQDPNATASQIDVANSGRAELKDAYRGPVDEFFFTIVYTILVYIIGTTCFKLIDMIPNEMLRWINAEIPSFNDGTLDSAEGLMKYVTIGGSQFGSSIGDSLSNVGGGVKDSVQQFIE